MRISDWSSDVCSSDLLAYGAQPLSREGAKSSLHVARSASVRMVAVLPEFACQLYSYLNSAQRQSGLHALMDVGAGTVDVAFFNVHERDGMDVLPIFSAEIGRAHV